MIKFVITAVIIYFVVRSISNKPWQPRQIHIHHDKKPEPNRQAKPSAEDDFVEYEEVD